MEDTTIERIRAALRLLSPDHITPMGMRIIEKVLDAEEQPPAPRGFRRGNARLDRMLAKKRPIWVEHREGE